MTHPSSSSDAEVRPDISTRSGSDDFEHYVRIHRTGGLSPFSKIEWEIIVRGETPIAKHAKLMVGYDEPLHKMVLLTAEEFSEVWRKIEQNDGFILYDVMDPAQALSQPTYDVEIRRAAD